MSKIRRRLFMAGSSNRSCYGRGYWDNMAKWSNVEGWIN